MNSLLSLPSGSSLGPYIEDACSAEVSNLFSDYGNQMLRPRAEVDAWVDLYGEPGCYTNPILLNDTKKYVGLI